MALHSSVNTQSSPLSWSAALVPATFAHLLRFWREREQPRISQIDVAEKIQSLSGTPYDRTLYSRLEAGTAYPRFDQLFVIYQAFRSLGILIAVEERALYLLLARRKIEAKATHQERRVTPEDWETLTHKIEMYERASPVPARQAYQPLSTPKPPKGTAHLADVRHVVGRDELIAGTVGQLLDPLAPKVLILQGSLGSGKSCVLHAVGWQLKQVIPCPPQIVLVEFRENAATFPDEPYLAEDRLDQLLSAVLTDLGCVADVEVLRQTSTLEERIEIAIKALEGAERTIILVDNAEGMLTSDGAITPSWERFLTAFTRRQHQVTVLLATREWPGWFGEGTYIRETVLPPLSPEAGAIILSRAGFAAVPEEVLRKASSALWNHPEAIQWLGRLAKKNVFAVSWSESGEDIRCQAQDDERMEDGSEETQTLLRVLRDPHIFSGSAVTVLLRPLLKRVISRRISRNAHSLLEVLAEAKVALLPESLEHIESRLYECHAELECASLLVSREDRFQLLPLVTAAASQSISLARRSEIERQLIQIYATWIELGSFSGEREQGQVVTELALLLLKHHQLLDAAELLIQYGWLSLDLGYGIPLARRVQAVMRQPDWEWRQSLESECGGLLLRAFLGRFLGEDRQSPERKQAYHRVFSLAENGSVALRPRTAVHVIHSMLRDLIKQDRYADAWSLIEDRCVRYDDLDLREREPITYAELLDNKAYVGGRWGDYQDVHQEQEEARKHWREAVAVHLHCIALLQQCELSASPLQRSHICFKRAKFLNDVAYYQRRVGNLEAARLAIVECLKLKEAGYSWPNSLAVSYGDYAQLLGELGHFRESLAYSEKALQIVQRLIDAGQRSLLPEKGMQLVDRGRLFLLLGRLEEAKSLFEEALPSVEGTPRRSYAVYARDSLQLIERQEREQSQRRLDWRWFDRYHELVDYNDIDWLRPAAFSPDDWRAWEAIADQRGEALAEKRMSSLIAQSRKREVAAAISEQREPRFHYPAIPIDEVRRRDAELASLRAEIERDEPNAIVRRFYMGAIDERLDELHLVDAAYRQDDEAFWTYNQRLFPPPTAQEMEIALAQFMNFVQKGLSRDDTHAIAARLLQLLWDWHLLPIGKPQLTSACEREALADEASPSTTSTGAMVRFPPDTVQRFFEQVFRTYQFPHTVVIDPDVASTRVDSSPRRLVLADKWVSLAKVRELLAHENEIHIFRTTAGAKSPLGLLSLGTQRYLATEEGLATYYALQAARAGSTSKPKLWIGTLATGLASGVVGQPRTFRELLSFFELVKLLTDQLDGKDAPFEVLQEDARKYALNRCLRIWRGVSHLAVPGIISNKDACYLTGFLAVCRAVEEDVTAFDRLMVGAVGVHQLQDLAELGIETPSIPHQHLAIDPHLDAYIMRFAESVDNGSAQ